MLQIIIISILAIALIISLRVIYYIVKRNKAKSLYDKKMTILDSSKKDSGAIPNSYSEEMPQKYKPDTKTENTTVRTVVNHAMGTAKPVHG